VFEDDEGLIFDHYDGPPFEHFYHVMGSTYGTWLPGDKRGFRTRHHREHVPYDYKHPPPSGMYDGLYEHAKKSMKRDPVYLTMEQRTLAVAEFVKSLTKRSIPIEALSIDRIHFHILAPFPDHDPRKWVGIAKKESSHYMKGAGKAPVGGLWAVRTECVPVKSAEHKHNVRGYIFKHILKGAVIYPEPEDDNPETPTELAPWDPF
jgi:hypothetical protein